MGFSYEVCSRIPELLEPYGDVAGLGVVLSFVISAWLTVLILVAYYVFAFNPHTNPFSSPDSNGPYDPNPLDVFLVKYTRYVRIRKSFRGSLAEEAFHKCILSLADAQLITGISILVSGYMSLKHGQGLIGLIPTGHFNFLGSQLINHQSSPEYGQLDPGANQIEYSKYIDLGHSIYPRGCEDLDKSHYYADRLVCTADDYHCYDGRLICTADDPYSFYRSVGSA
ncbi:hypothetical protein CCHR01_09231 [Colletotrichum chrysophilum]|uniref:Uncharacterized protein n=1 Tax=Colletotrichum chrysophilum TaxID=1836956 RepID=A0AAD9EGX3_9PEZI|nr:hypothetical protein CCHR01_09231 [Colletotrichum chrysophilum]